MSIALDGFKVLKRLGEAPQTFATIRGDVDDAARKLVVKCLKAKTTDLAAVCEIHRALHDKQFELIVDRLNDTDLKSLLTKLDKHHPELKSMSSQERRRHLVALSSRVAEPSLRMAKSNAAKKSSVTKKTATKKSELQPLQSDVMDLFRARGKIKDD